MATQQQIKIIHTLLSRARLTAEKETFVYQFTENRTSHVSDMTNDEADKMRFWLEKLTEDRKSNNDKKADSMRRKILHLMGLMGYTTEGGRKFDYVRINNFIKNIGSNNPQQVTLNYLKNNELRLILTQLEQIMIKPNKVKKVTHRK